MTHLRRASPTCPTPWPPDEPKRVTVSDADVNSIPAIIPENQCEQRKAKKLMAEVDDIF